MQTTRLYAFICAILSSVLFISISSAQGKFSLSYYGKSYALVVGINQYPSPSWETLENAGKGARAVAAMLSNHGFEVTTLYDAEATRNDILANLNTIISRAQKEDRFLFYFAGHGEKQNTTGYLIPYDGNNFDSYLSLQEITNAAKKLSAKHQLYVMDACYAGFIKTRGGASAALAPKDPRYLQKVTGAISKRALTAGGKNQKVLDSGGPDGHSPFTGYFLQGVQKGKADGNGDGFITLAEIHNYLLPNASNDYSDPQDTSLPGDDDGMFVFASEIGATQNFAANKPMGGKMRAKTKKQIGNPIYKDEQKQYGDTLSAMDWLDKGDETESIDYAIECYSNAIRLYPNFTEAYYNRALTYEELAESDLDNSAGLFLKAIEDYRKVLELDPGDVDCYFNIGALYHEMKRLPEALQAFNQALEIYPEDTYSLTYRGDVYLEMHMTEAAFGDYNRALSIDPDDGYLYFDRGDAYLYLEKYDNAINDLNKAISLIPDEADFYYARGEAFEAIGQMDKAENDHRRGDELMEAAVE